MATHSSILAWEIPWTEEPSGLQSMGSQRVRHDLVTKQQQRDVSCHFQEKVGYKNILQKFIEATAGGCLQHFQTLNEKCAHDS